MLSIGLGNMAILGKYDHVVLRSICQLTTKKFFISGESLGTLMSVQFLGYLDKL